MGWFPCSGALKQTSKKRKKKKKKDSSNSVQLGSCNYKNSYFNDYVKWGCCIFVKFLVFIVILEV